MFCIDDEKRQELITEDIGLVEDNPELEALLSWPDAHIIMVRPTPDDSALTLILQIYAAKAAVRVISRTRSHWHGRIPASGLVYVVLSGLRRYVGPIPFPDLMAWRADSSRFPNDDLNRLKLHRDNFPPVPSPANGTLLT